MNLPLAFVRTLLCHALLLLAWSGSSFAADLAHLHGAGATFPFPIYAKWAKAYFQSTGTDVAYDPIGSGAGIEQFDRHQVDFGASDAPLSNIELQRLKAWQFPAVIGGVVPVLNVGGIKPGALRLSGQVLGDIYLGRIRKWNDQAIAQINPGIRLPNVNITVVHRLDASGTTFLWSDFLSKTNLDWKARIGTATMPAWLVGVGGTGNEGVASHVQRTRNSIGYVEYNYARQHHLAFASVRNHDGAYVLPSRASFEAAVSAADWEKPSDLVQLLTDLPGQASWPITGSSFIVLPIAHHRQRNTVEVIEFFAWAFKNGQRAAWDLDYVPLPKAARVLVEQAWGEPDH